MVNEGNRCFISRGRKGNDYFRNDQTNQKKICFYFAFHEVEQKVPLRKVEQSTHWVERSTPLDYDYDYSSKIRWVDTSGKLREIESYIIYIYIYKYI